MGGRHEAIENRGFLHFGGFAGRSTRVLEAEEGIVGATESTCCFNTRRGAKRHDVYAAEICISKCRTATKWASSDRQIRARPDELRQGSGDGEGKWAMGRPVGQSRECSLRYGCKRRESVDSGSCKPTSEHGYGEYQYDAGRPRSDDPVAELSRPERDAYLNVCC